MTQLVLFPFQKEGIRRIEQHRGRTLLADEMGLGKTLQALGYYLRNPSQYPAIFIVPASVKINWQREATKFGLVLETINGTSRQPLSYPAHGFILNYDIAKYHVDTLLKLKTTFICLDEIQNISSPTAQRTQATQAICRGGARRILGMSGTPLMNRPFELFTGLNLIWPKEFPSLHDYAWRYCGPSKNRGRWEFKGAARVKELNRRLIALGMIRRTVEEVLPDLPETLRAICPIELSDRQQYREAATDFKKWIIKHHHKKAFKALKMEQLSRIGYLLRLVGKLKVRGINNWIDEFLTETDEKIVLFCAHRKMLDCLRRRYPAIHTHIDGTVSSKKRQEAVDIFHANKKIRLFLGTKAATAGINLQHTARHVAFLECYWRPADHTQASARVRRIGQTSTTWEHWLMAPNTIEEKMAEVLQTKQSIINGVLDGGRGEDLPILDILIEALAKEEDT